MGKSSSNERITEYSCEGKIESQDEEQYGGGFEVKNCYRGEVEGMMRGKDRGLRR